MAGVALFQAVERFAQSTRSIPDDLLEREWKWGDYEEGVRFAFFLVYEELRQLAAALEAMRAVSAKPLTPAQRIIRQYHAAYRDLDAVLLSADHNKIQVPPADGEWSLWDILLHMIEAEQSFFAINIYALEGARRQDGRTEEMSEEDWHSLWSGDPFQQIRANENYAELLSYYDHLHQRVIETFADVTTEELRLPVPFWEGTHMPLQFRLHRFDSHLRQHTIQAEKALSATEQSPSEAQRLLRLIYAALAQAEGNAIGLAGFATSEQAEVARLIAGYTAEIAPLLA